MYKGKYFSPAQWDYTEDWKKKFNKLLQDYTTMSDSQKLALDKIDWWRYLVNNGCEGRDLDLRELLDSTDFGDNTHSDLPTPTHTYTEPGVYLLEVSIYNISWGNDCFYQLEYEVVVEEQGTGIADTKHPRLHFYPNPAQDMIYLPSLLTDQAYTLYNTQGAALLSANTKDRKIDLSALASGLYFIHFPEMGMIKIIRE